MQTFLKYCCLYLLQEQDEPKVECGKPTKEHISKQSKTAEAGEKPPPEPAPRKVLPIPSVGVPWGLIPNEDDQHHCKNSIPHTTDLGVIMEPVVYLPRPASSGQQRACANLPQPPLRNKDNLVENDDERGNVTSAYR